nr:MAG TPA: hypothetical protein [Caudoviricetes sp.]
MSYLTTRAVFTLVNITPKRKAPDNQVPRRLVLLL